MWETAPGKPAYPDSLVVDPLRSQIAAVLLHYGYVGIVPMLLALAAMTRSRWRIGSDAAEELPLAALIGVLTFVGMTVLGVAAWRAGFFPWAMVLPVPASVATIALPVGAVQGEHPGHPARPVPGSGRGWPRGGWADDERVTGLRRPLNP